MNQTTTSRPRPSTRGLLSLAAFAVSAVLLCHAGARAQNAPTGPAGGDLSGTYPNPTLGTDRVRKTGDTMTGVLNVSLPNPGTVVIPFSISSGGNALLNRGTAMHFYVPHSGATHPGGQITTAWGSNAQTFMSFSAYNGAAMAEVFRADARGYFGIGTNNPTNRLHVASGTASATTLLFLDTGVAGGTTMTVGASVNNESAFDLAVYRAGSYVSRFAVNNYGQMFLQPGDGNVGIGTTNPGAAHKLDVAGKINASLGLCMAGTCKGSWSEVTGGSQWTTAGSNLHFDTGNVGLGISTPAVKFDVLGSGRFQGPAVNLTVKNTTGWSQVMVSRSTGQAAFIAAPSIPYDVNNPYWAMGLGSDGSAGWSLESWNGTSMANRVRVLPNGNVGFGNTAPLYKLDVNGQVNASGGLCINAECKSSWAQVGGSQWSTSGTNIHFDTGNVGVGTSSPTSPLEVSKSQAAATTLQVTNSATGAGSAAALRVFTAGSNALTLSANEHASSGGYASINQEANLPLLLKTNNAERLRITGAGNVGIGTNAPTEKLHVEGNIHASGSINAKYQDVAEWVPSTQELEAGTVVVLDAGRSNHVLASSEAYDTRVAGVVSARPGLILGEGGKGKVMVATTGRVKVKVDATRSPVRIGDILVTSGVGGVAMKSVPFDMGGVPIHRPGTIIGKALEPLAKGTGEILVLLSLQ